MYYDPRQTSRPEPLTRSPLSALVVPRPIGWISTVNATGKRNLAPFSFFNIACTSPPCVMFCPSGPHAHGGPLDTLRNIQETGEFVINIADEALQDEVVQSAATVAPDIDEFELVGLDVTPSVAVAPPRVLRAKAALECELIDVHPLPSDGDKINNLVLGRVVGVFIDDRIIVDGLVDISRLRPLTRLGYLDYAIVAESFQKKRP